MRAVFHRQRLPAGCRGFGIVNLIRRTGTEAIMILGLNSLDIRSTESAEGAVAQWRSLVDLLANSLTKVSE